MYLHTRESCTHTLIAALFIRAKRWKYHLRPPADKQANKMSPCTVGCSAGQKEYRHAPTQTILENIMHNLKRLDTKGHTSYDPVYMKYPD